VRRLAWVDTHVRAALVTATRLDSTRRSIAVARVAGRAAVVVGADECLTITVT
jgi:hypothetical protein